MSMMKRALTVATAAAALLLVGCASQGTTETGGVTPTSGCASGACGEQIAPAASCKGMSSCKGTSGCKGMSKKKRAKAKAAAEA